MSVATFMSLALIASSLLTILYVLKNPSRFSKYISVRKLGIIERDLTKLERVIVVANQIDRPTGTLLEAVEDNFSEGVHYLFLVSKSQGAKARRQWFQLFEAIARVVKSLKGLDIPTEDLVSIRSLEYEWPSEPHIFYQYKRVESGELTTFCYRGNTNGEGISRFYVMITDSSIEAMLRGLLSGAPSEIEIGTIVQDNNPHADEIVETLNSLLKK